MNRPRGRPTRSHAIPSRESMLSSCLEFLDAEGVDAFTMRALAMRLQVNPMTIYHHFRDRDGLIEAMSEYVYRGVSAPESGPPQFRIKGLLQSYHSQVLKHTGLALLIFSSQTAFPDQARRITEELVQLLNETGMPSERSQLWVSILVDFTHGAAIATATSRRTSAQGSSGGASADDGYSEALEELLDGLPNSR